MKHHIINILLLFLFGTLFLESMTFVTNKFVFPSFEYNLEFQQREYSDMCVGDTEQTLTMQRIVRPNGFKSVNENELFKYENGEWVELANRRTTYPYFQDNGSEEFTLINYWSRPVTEPGLYGVGTEMTINPVSGVYKTKYFFPSENTFNVIECNHD